MRDNGSPITRRGLLRYGLCGPLIAGMAAGCEIDEDLSGPDETGTSFAVGEYPQLETIGGAARITLNGINEGRLLMVVRTSVGEFAVLNAICTHQGCPVDLPGPQSTTLNCPCHASVFSIDSGAVLSGPAPAPLTVYRSAFDTRSGMLTVFG